MAITRGMARKYYSSVVSRRGQRRPNTATNRVRKLNYRTTFGPSARGTLRQQIRSLQRSVKSLAPEIKYADIAISAQNIPTTGFVQQITGIGQGDTQSTRTGNTVNVCSIAVRGSFAGAADAPQVSFARILIVQDREQVADTAPTAASIITDGAFTANPFSCLPNLDNLERFKILHVSPVYDLKMMYLDSDQLFPPTQSPLFEYNWSGNVKVSFNGTASTDMDKNNIYFVILSDVTAATADWVGVSRVGFTDV